MEYIYYHQLHNAVIDVLKLKTEISFNILYKEVTKIFRQNKIATINRKGKGRKVTNTINFQLSKAYFSKILKTLEEEGYINKRTDEQSKRNLSTVYYSLTEKARKTLQLQVLHKTDKQKEFKRIYQRIIFNRFLNGETVIYSAQEFNEFLDKLNVKKEDIEWGSVEHSSIPQISLILYPDAPFHHRVSKKQQEIVNQELWKDPNVQTREIPAEFICFPLKENSDFEVKKIEWWEMNKNKKNNLLLTKYKFFKPGISREDLIGDEENENIDTAIKILQENKLIRPIFFAQEECYVISDPELESFTSIISSTFESFYNILLIKMIYFDQPNDKEINIMNEYLGQDFKGIKNKIELKRYEFKKRVKECSNVIDYYDLLKEEDIKNGTNLSLVTDVRDFLQEKNYKPKHTDKFDGDIKKISTDLLDSYSKKKMKKMVDEYYIYIKEKVYKQLNWLPVNFENEGLEEIKIDYENIIKKYSFLKEIIESFFPMIFEPPNIELQKDILSEQALGAYIDPKTKKSLNELYEIEKIGKLEYEYENENMSEYEERKNDIKYYSPIPDMEIIPIKKQRRKVPFRILYVRHLDTGERKEIKIYRNFTVRPF